MVSSATSPAAARTPTWRMPPPSRLRSSAGPVDRGRRARPAPTRRARRGPSTGTTSPSWRRAARSRRSTPVATAALNSRAPSRWIGTPTAATAASAVERPRPPARGHVGVLDAHDATARASGGLGALDQPAHRGRVERAVVVVDDVELGHLVDARRAALVRHDVLAPPGHHRGARRRRATRSATWLAIVPDGTNSAASLPTRSAKRCLEAVDGGVLAEAVVAHLGLGHGPPHRGRRAGHGVGAQVDGRAERWWAASQRTVPSLVVTCRPIPRHAADPGAARRAGQRRRRAGRCAAARRAARRPRATVETKSSPTDMVTEMDRASERLIVSTLLAARPDDGILGEEGSTRPGTSGAAVGRRPARRHDQLPVRPSRLGRVDRRRGRRRGGGRRGGRPAHGELFTATRGGGARRDGEPIRCLGLHDLATALVGTGFGYDARAAARGRRRCWSRCCPGSATSAAWGRPPSTCARWRAAGSTPTTSGGWPVGPGGRRPDRRRGRRGRDRAGRRTRPGRTRCWRPHPASSPRCVTCSALSAHKMCRESPRLAVVTGSQRSLDSTLTRTVGILVLMTSAAAGAPPGCRPSPPSVATPRSTHRSSRRALTHRRHDRGEHRRARRRTLPRRGRRRRAARRRVRPPSTPSRAASTSTSAALDVRTPTPAPVPSSAAADLGAKLPEGPPLPHGPRARPRRAARRLHRSPTPAAVRREPHRRARRGASCTALPR